MPKPIEKKPLRILTQVVGWAILALLPVYILCMIEYIHFANKAAVFTFFLERGSVVLFDLGLLYLIWLCLLCIVKKGWIATLVYSGFFGAVSYVNYLKHAMTGDYFYPWDIQQTGNLGELTNFITVPFPVLYAILIFFGLALTVPVFFSGASLPLRWQVRTPLVLLLVGCTAFSVSTPKKVTALLNQSSLYLEDMALQTSNYTVNGFVGAFTVNVLSANIQKPEDYGKEAVDALLSDFAAIPADETFSSPDIILVLSESFWDPTLLPGTTFSRDPLAGYRALCEEEGVISGRFFTTGFGGGTVRPEFEVLTGMTTDYLPSGCVPWQYVTSEAESYVSLYRDMGYTTMAIHPYTASFYNRKSAYPLIGIDTLHFEDDIYALNGEIDVTIRGKQISDDTFVDAIAYYMDKAAEEDGAPQFVFGISMENHQPYPNKFDPKDITAENPAFDDAVANAVSNFTQGAADADRSLVRLTDYIKNRDRDTVLVWFGDHLPTLGAGFGAYVQSGMVGAYDEADYERLYSTPFMVYANFALSESDMLHAGKDNDITTYNLMNAVADLIGAPRTAYMDYLESYYETIPYYNVRLHKAVSDEAKAFIEGHKMLTYDRIAGNGYSLNQ